MNRKPGTALLLTVMIMAVLTSTTLSAIAIRFDQLSATDRINNSAIAKSAADAGVFRLKYMLRNQPERLAQATAIDLQTGEESNVDTSDFRPRPNRMVTTIERSGTELPKCIAVAVLAPWVNDGQYIGRNSSSANPALIFHYANIINDTSLGTIPDNANDPLAETTISSLTNMGHFYNPYAPVGSVSSDPNHWLINLGGPNDEFLTRKAEDGVHSYYRNLDLVYIPYLPRFTDTGIISRTAVEEVALERKSALEVRRMFEEVIRRNNFKVWLDASISQANINQYGFGDLFSESSEYRINWLQPRLWNDTPELDRASGVFISRANTLFGTGGNTAIEWERKELPVLTAANATNWTLARRVNILKGTRTFSFVSGTGARAFSADGGFEAQLFGSLEGIRPGHTVRFRMFHSGGTRHNDAIVTITRIRQDGGRIIVSFTRIANPASILVNNTNVAPSWQNIDYAALIADPMPSTDRSVSISNLTDLDTDGASANDTTTDGRNISLSFGAGSNCAPSQSQNCLATGDIIDLVSSSGNYAPGQAPVWGKVSSVSYNSAGDRQMSAVVDSLRIGPKPLKNVASTSFVDGVVAKIAYFGGEMANLDYDGGFNTEVNDLWFYTPLTNTWEYRVSSINSIPRLAGSAMSFDQDNNRLVIFGGFNHRPNAVGISADPEYCFINRTACRDRNQPGLRMARYVSNTMFYHPIGGTPQFNQVNYTNNAQLAVNEQYVVRVLSTLPNRSGMERWQWNVSRNFSTPRLLSLSGNAEQIISLAFDQSSLAGLSAGDEVYISGNLTSGPGYEAWGTIGTINYQTQTISLRFRGYKVPDAVEATQVQVNSINIRVLNRQTAGETCTGRAGNICQFASPEQLRGYSPGDLVALEHYFDNNTRLGQIFTGYIASIDGNNQLRFTTDETVSGNSNLRDYVNTNINTSQIRNIPAPVYGATMSRPVDGKIYLTGGASVNIMQSVSFQSVWVFDIATSSWSKPVNRLAQPRTVANPANPDRNDPGNYNLRLIELNASSQIYLDHAEENVPVQRDSTVTVNDPSSPGGVRTISSWGSRVWEFTVRTDSTEANAIGKFIPNLASQTPITLERRLANGSREVFRGVFEGFDPQNNRLRLRHDSRFQSDSGFSTANGNTATNIVATFFRSNWTGERIQDIGGQNRESVIWDSAQRRIIQRTQNSSTFALPVGAVAIMWRSIGDDINNTSSFIFSVRDRTVAFDSATNIYTYTYTTNGPLLAAPDPWAFQTTVFDYQPGTNVPPTVITQGSSIMNEFFPRAFTWTYSPGDSEPTWQIQNNREFRNSPEHAAPTPRIGYNSATHFDGTTSRHIFLGAFRGLFATVWELRGAASTPRWRWNLRSSPADIALEIPSLSHGTLEIFNDGTTPRAVYFGGKVRNDNSSNDDGRTYGTFTLGMPDVDRPSSNGRAEDGSTLVVDNRAESHPKLWSLSNNLDPRFNQYRDSLTFSDTFRIQNRSLKPCLFIGQENCNRVLVNMMGRLGRISDNYNQSQLSLGVYGVTTWEGSRAVVHSAGSRFQFTDVAGTRVRSAILTAPVVSHTSLNARWDQEGYNPFMKDNTDPSGGADNYDYSDSRFLGTNASDFNVDRALLFSGFASISGGGAILFTATSVGDAIANNRGSAGRPFSYCAKSDLSRDTNGNLIVVNDAFVCDTNKMGARFIPHLPDSEDVLFMLNASTALAALDSFKVVGYFAGVKRAYSVNARTVDSIIIQEVAP